MNRSYRASFALASLFFAGSVLPLAGETFEGFTYTLNNGAATITAGPDVADLKIPEQVFKVIGLEVQFYPVVSIGPNAFKSSNVVNVTIPKFVTTIGVSAFAYCSELSSLTFDSPSFVDMRIEDGAFFDCRMLTTLELPEGLVKIGNGAFSIDQPFIPQPIGPARTIVVPSTVTEWGSFAFAHCNAGSVVCKSTAIGPWAFDRCRTLNSVTLQNTQHIGDYAFQSSKISGRLVLPGSVKTIGEGAFQSCRDLVEVEMSAGVTGIGLRAFYHCDQLTKVTIPNTVTSIGDEAFQYCVRLESLLIPDSVTEVGSRAFYHCSTIDIETGNRLGLRSVTFGRNVRSIGAEAFYDCRRLSKVDFLGPPPETVGENAFGYVNVSKYRYVFGTPGWGGVFRGRPTEPFYLEFGPFLYGVYTGEATIWGVNGNDEELNIPATLEGYPVTRVGPAAFRDRLTLKRVTMPDSVTEIETNTFQGCAALDTVNIPGAVTHIGDGAFLGCSSLASVDLPGPLASIGLEAFSGCSSLAAVNIPGNVTRIESETFEGCSSLATVVLPGGLASIGGGAFEGCSSLATVVLPGGLASIGDGAFVGCSALTAMNIPGSVTQIGNQAFTSCESLASITVDPGNATYSSQDGVLFNKLATELLLCPEGRTGHYQIPGGVERLRGLVFYNCQFLESVNIPDSVTFVDRGAFAFRGCHSLTSITVDPGNAVYSDLDGVLFNKLASELVAFPPGRAGHYQVPDSVTTIAAHSFSSCRLLTNVSLGRNVSSIGFQAFWGLNMRSMTIPASVTSIEWDAFGGSQIRRLYMLGAPPVLGGPLGGGIEIYYLAGTPGWESMLGEHATRSFDPYVSIQRGGGSLEIEYAGGVLQESSDLAPGGWIDSLPQPAPGFPVPINVGGGERERFYRIAE